MDTILANPRHERFASLIALEDASINEAYRKCGYKTGSGSGSGHKLSRDPLVASRIKWLQDRKRSRQDVSNEIKLDITRERIASELSKMAFNGCASMIKLKAMDLLVRLMGYNEPARTEVSHMHLHIDSGLAAQLREGYAQLSNAKPDVMSARYESKPDMHKSLPINGEVTNSMFVTQDAAPALEVKHEAQDVACATIEETPATHHPPVLPPGKEHAGTHRPSSHTQGGKEEGASENL